MTGNPQELTLFQSKAIAVMHMIVIFANEMELQGG